MYALIGIDEDEEKDTNGKFEFRPVGKGVQNFPEILKVAEKAGTEWVVVEQDNPSLNLTPIECAEESIKYLKTII
jgi:sugar phosphate isomerase/epimerase